MTMMEWVMLSADEDGLARVSSGLDRVHVKGWSCDAEVALWSDWHWLGYGL